MFDAGPSDYGKPPILLGGLGPVMTAVAGEVADGLIVHPFNSIAFVEQHAMPALQRGLERAQRKLLIQGGYHECRTTRH